MGPSPSVKTVLSLQRAYMMHFLFLTQTYSKTFTSKKDLWLVLFIEIYTNFNALFTVEEFTG